jgi:hypothetical protein
MSRAVSKSRMPVLDRWRGEAKHVRLKSMTTIIVSNGDLIESGERLHEREDGRRRRQEEERDSPLTYRSILLSYFQSFIRTPMTHIVKSDGPCACVSSFATSSSNNHDPQRSEST